MTTNVIDVTFKKEEVYILEAGIISHVLLPIVSEGSWRLYELFFYHEAGRREKEL